MTSIAALRNRLLAAAVLLSSLYAVPAMAQFSSPMRDVENPDRFMFSVTASGGPTAPFVNGFIQFPAQALKRHFIDQVSLTCNTPTATDLITGIILSTLKQESASFVSSNSHFDITMTRVGPAPFGGYTWQGGARMRIFSDINPFDTNGGKPIVLNIFHTEASQNVSCSATVTGHFLP